MIEVILLIILIACVSNYESGGLSFFMTSLFETTAQTIEYIKSNPILLTMVIIALILQIIRLIMTIQEDIKDI